MPRSEEASREIAAGLQRLAQDAALFFSMPWLEGLSPRVLNDRERAEVHPSGEFPERRHGVFRVDEIGLPVFDHGALYGDSVFEGVLVTGGRLFTWKEHLARMYSGAKSLEIDVPYNPVDLSLQIMRTVREAGYDKEDLRYVRLVLTRGLGDLGIHPKKCLGGMVFAIVAKIQLYPEELYERGIDLSIAREVRRPGGDVLNPRIKSSNYLNNIMALLEVQEGNPETLMLNQRGYVAEATADNLFLVTRTAGWEQDPSRVVVSTPSAEYCLEGITRSLTLEAARGLGYRCEETPSMLPGDLVGPEREVFLTGTGAGLVPVISVGGQTVGDALPGPVTRNLRGKLLDAMADPGRGLSVEASRKDVESYLAP